MDASLLVFYLLFLLSPSSLSLFLLSPSSLSLSLSTSLKQMGLCFSQRKESPSPPPDPIPKSIPNEKNVEKEEEKQRVAAAAAQPAAEVATEKKQVFVITQTAKKTAAAAAAAEEKKDKKKAETPTKKSYRKEESGGGSGGDRSPLGPVRTSSCTKEEVDAILIQCGRLSRSSSGKASSENGGGHRKYSGSKRSYDFDNEKKGDEEEAEWEKPISRPSPRRRTPGRERSGSRERSNGGGGRRGSRSPGRRSEGPTSTSSSSAGDKSKQPAKMVSVPAREKGGGGFVAEAGGVGAKRASSSAAACKRGGEARGPRSASPRSRSPANTTARTANENALHHNPQPSQPQSLSRSSSRKAEQSPCRRNPMAEIDENSLRGNQNASNNCKAQKIKEGDEGLRKPSQSQTQKTSEKSANLRKSEQRNGGAVEVTKSTSVITSSLQMGLKALEGAPLVDEGPSKDGEAHLTSNAVESLNPRTMTRTRSSRRSSRDFDHAPDLNQDNHLNPASYTSLLLEDIHNYHQKNIAFSLPACVSKACSILEAVADLNSSCSENKSSGADRSNNDNGSLNGGFGRRGLVPKGAFVESEIVVKDDLMEPSLHKYVSVRDLGGEMEPQESAGSNSFIGQPWSSPWEPNSADSTDQYWTSQSINGDEVEQQQRRSMPEVACDSEARGRRSRGGSRTNSLPTSISSGSKKRESDHHRPLHRGGSNFSGGSGKAGGSRSLSLPAAAAAAGGGS